MTCVMIKKVFIIPMLDSVVLKSVSCVVTSIYNIIRISVRVRIRDTAVVRSTFTTSNLTRCLEDVIALSVLDMAKKNIFSDVQNTEVSVKIIRNNSSLLLTTRYLTFVYYDELGI